MAKWNFVAMGQVGLTGWTKELVASDLPLLPAADTLSDHPGGTRFSAGEALP